MVSSYKQLLIKNEKVGLMKIDVIELGGDVNNVMEQKGRL